MKTVAATPEAAGRSSVGRIALTVATPALLAAVLIAAPARAEGTPDVREEIRCLALTIYFEARGEPMLGKLAVGHVVMNRVQDPRFPGRVCSVVRQGGEEALYRCQFSWWCDGQSDQPAEDDVWRISQALARRVYWQPADDPTRGALWYHADYVEPRWHDRVSRGPRIGRHVFYHIQEGGSVAGPQLARSRD